MLFVTDVTQCIMLKTRLLSFVDTRKLNRSGIVLFFEINYISMTLSSLSCFYVYIGYRYFMSLAKKKKKGLCI